MTTESRIEANRRNAQKSTGPRTPEGKAASRLNALKHGLSAKTLVLPGEAESDFESLLDSFHSERLPATPTEKALVRQLAMAQWRLLRLYHMEAAHYARRIDDLEHYAKRDKLNRAQHNALVIDRDYHLLDRLSRHEARLERSFYKALSEFRARARQEKENGAPAPPASSPDPA